MLNFSSQQHLVGLASPHILDILYPWMGYIEGQHRFHRLFRRGPVEPSSYRKNNNRPKAKWMRNRASRVKIIGESPHEWPKTSLFMATNMLVYFLHAFLVLKHREIVAIPIDRSPCPCCLRWWHCDIMQTPIVTSFFTLCSQNVSKWVACVFPPSSSWLFTR